MITEDHISTFGKYLLFLNKNQILQIYLLHSTNVTRDILVLNFIFLIMEKSDILWSGHADAKQNTKTE